MAQASDSMNRVLTAPLALIKVGDVTVGKAKNIRVTESFTRGRVVGIGELTPSEIPVTGWTGTVSISFMTIDLKKSMIPGLINRIGSVSEFVTTMLLQEQGVDLVIFKKVKNTVNKPDDQYKNLGTTAYPQRNIGGGLVEFATITSAFCTREGFDVSEGQISGRDVEMEYLNPILYSNFGDTILDKDNIN